MGVCAYVMHGRSHDHGPSPPYNAGTEHVGFSPTRQTLLAPSPKRREVFGESHEGWAASYKEPLVRRTFLHIDGGVERIDLFSGVATTRDSNGVNM